MAAAKTLSAAPALPSVLPTAGFALGLLDLEVAAPGVAAGGAALDVMGQLALVVSAAAAGGLSGVDSEHALAVVEAVESVKAWADSVALDATAAMVSEFECDFVEIAPQSPSTRLWTVFVRSCRSAAAREIQVAPGLPIPQCRRRVWLSACAPERGGCGWGATGGCAWMRGATSST